MSNTLNGLSAQGKVRIPSPPLIQKESVSDVCARYIIPKDKLDGQAKTMLSEREAKLPSAREVHKLPIDVDSHRIHQYVLSC